MVLNATVAVIISVFVYQHYHSQRLNMFHLCIFLLITSVLVSLSV